jgi:hypothetical protein
MSCLRALAGPDGPELGLDVQGVHALESLLMARYHMFLQVYFHKTPPAFEYYLERAIEEGEVQFELNGSACLLDLRDDAIRSQLHAARAKGLRWSRRIVEREPAKLILQEWVDAREEQTSQSLRLVDCLRDAGCHVFVRRSRQVFTHIAGPGCLEEGRRLLCERRLFGRSILESVTRHSVLLATFNQPIDLRHVYVLREDCAKAADVLNRLGCE